MGWAHADYLEQSDAAGRLAGLRRHLTEVQQAIHSRRDALGQSVDPELLVEYRKQLIEEEAGLTGTVEAESRAAISRRAAFTRGRVT